MNFFPLGNVYSEIVTLIFPPLFSSLDSSESSSAFLSDIPSPFPLSSFFDVEMLFPFLSNV